MQIPFPLPNKNNFKSQYSLYFIFIPQNISKNAGPSVRRFPFENLLFSPRIFLSPVREALFLITNKYLYTGSEIEIR